METTHLTQAPYHPDFLPPGVFNPAGNPEQESDWQAWCDEHPWLVEVQTPDHHNAWVAHEVLVPTKVGPLPFRSMALRYATEAEALDAISFLAHDFSPEELTAIRCRHANDTTATVLVLAIVHDLPEHLNPEGTLDAPGARV